jgi:hypothetical protein
MSGNGSTSAGVAVATGAGAVAATSAGAVAVAVAATSHGAEVVDRWWQQAQGLGPLADNHVSAALRGRALAP